jgi:hypothetical protein
MFYYTDEGEKYFSFEKNHPLTHAAPFDEGKECFLFARDPTLARTVFHVSSVGQLVSVKEDMRWLDAQRLPKPTEIAPQVLHAIEGEELQAVNTAHPRWREARKLNLLPNTKCRLNILALGDVGSTLLMGLKLLGGDVLSQIGIFDVRPQTAQRWEFEMNQIAIPWEYDGFPEVKVIEQSALFDCDVFVFCASRYIPPVGSTVKDVRMAQFESNAPLVASYARQARECRFKGLFCVVSDPVDPLCKKAFIESNRGEDGTFDGLGLFSEQIKGFGLGVMNARAAYYAKQNPEFSRFLKEGRSFGPHGDGLIVADSIENYRNTLSCELTELVVKANLVMRSIGYKPFVAPALSSGALSLLRMLRGEWHYSSTFLGGVYWGAKNRLIKSGSQIEMLQHIPDALFERIQKSARILSSIV